jgi:hypothetical protein
MSDHLVIGVLPQAGDATAELDVALFTGRGPMSDPGNPGGTAARNPILISCGASKQWQLLFHSIFTGLTICHSGKQEEPGETGF